MEPNENHEFPILRSRSDVCTSIRVKPVPGVSPVCREQTRKLKFSAERGNVTTLAVMVRTKGFDAEANFYSLKVRVGFSGAHQDWID